jgi:hypothetical protein
MQRCTNRGLVLAVVVVRRGAIIVGLSLSVGDIGRVLLLIGVRAGLSVVLRVGWEALHNGFVQVGPVLDNNVVRSKRHDGC